MASLVPGFAYDVFVSYRHKDNLYDGWVTDFVNNLKKELEATFKDDVSVYFDANPEDGIRDVHNVDKSLEYKLRTLVFIPILSQTYWDPKSFALQHEFLRFNELASADEFGKDVRVKGGNFISRVLPVKIHDVDPEDIHLLESALGSKVRAIDFVYREPGVNRALQPGDSEIRNLGKGSYRNGNLTSALEHAEKCTEPFWRDFALSLVLWRQQRTDEANAKLDFIKKNYPHRAFRIAEIYAYRGDKENAFKWLNQACELHETRLNQINISPLLRNIHSDPRFAATLKRMGVGMNVVIR